MKVSQVTSTINHRDPTLIELWWLKLRGLGLIDKYIASVRGVLINKLNNKTYKLKTTQNEKTKTY